MESKRTQSWCVRRRTESQIRDEVLAGQKMSWHAYRANGAAAAAAATTAAPATASPGKKYKTGDPAAGPLVLPFASEPPYFLPTLRVYENELCPARTSAECKICNTMVALAASASLSLSLSLSLSSLRARTEASGYDTRPTWGFYIDNLESFRVKWDFWIF